MWCESAYCLVSKGCSCPVADFLRRLGLPPFTTDRLPSRELEVHGDVLFFAGEPVLRREGEAVLFRVRCGRVQVSWPWPLRFVLHEVRSFWPELDLWVRLTEGDLAVELDLGSVRLLVRPDQPEKSVFLEREGWRELWRYGDAQARCGHLPWDEVERRLLRALQLRLRNEELSEAFGQLPKRVQQALVARYPKHSRTSTSVRNRAFLMRRWLEMDEAERVALLLGF